MSGTFRKNTWKLKPEAALKYKPKGIRCQEHRNCFIPCNRNISDVDYYDGAISIARAICRQLRIEWLLDSDIEGTICLMKELRKAATTFTKLPDPWQVRD
jgi:hypothetical protein